MTDTVKLHHGNGGVMSHKLIKEVFVSRFSNQTNTSCDSAILRVNTGEIAFTTDSYVVSPVFFRGGDIGKIAVCGTVNDLAVSGAKPLFLSCGFIIEEGFEISDLEKIADSMANIANKCGVQIVTGDTKVVPRGCADKIFINTSGIGSIISKSCEQFCKGDKVIVTGTIGDHGASILLSRENMFEDINIKSDCAPLSTMLNDLSTQIGPQIVLMKDPTRGGVATTLNEIINSTEFGIELDAQNIPVNSGVKGVCNMLGLDPLYLANEGKALIVVKNGYEQQALNILKQHEYGKNSCMIGEVTQDFKGKVVSKSQLGIHKIIDMLYQDQLPRIC